MQTTSSSFAQWAADVADGLGRDIQALQQSAHTQRLEEKTEALLYSMACTQLQAGRFAQAGKYFHFLNFYVPGHVDYLHGLGLCASQLQQWELAANALGTALYLEPESLTLALAWAEALQHVGMPRVAQQVAAQVARSADPQQERALSQRAQLLVQALSMEPAAHAA